MDRRWKMDLMALKEKAVLLCAWDSWAVLIISTMVSNTDDMNEPEERHLKMGWGVAR